MLFIFRRRIYRPDDYTPHGGQSTKAKRVPDSIRFRLNKKNLAPYVELDFF